jgi:hypothetical protein
VIAKISRGGGFGGCVRYLLNERPNLEREKQPEIVGGNMAGRSSGELGREFEAIRRLRRDVQKPVLHVAISLDPKDRPAIEDTKTTSGELRRKFGLEVANLVSEVTDDKSLPKAKRKRLQIKNAPHKSRRAKIMKIADKTSNLRSIVSSPPVDWGLRRQQEYFEWAAKVVEGCRGVNPFGGFRRPRAAKVLGL